MSERVCVSSLRFHHALYPRAGIAPGNVSRLKEALSMNATLPPVIVWRDGSQIIDGWHRVTAVKELHGDEAYIEVEWRDYPSKAEAFEDAILLNAGHGQRISPSDFATIQKRAQALGLEQKRIAVALKVPVVKLHRSAPGRVIAKATPSGSGWRVNAQGPSPVYQSPEQRRMAVASVQHDQSVLTALRDLAERMTPQSEAGPGHLAAHMRSVQEARKNGVGLRDALLSAAGLFVWWAARTQADDAGTPCRRCGAPLLAAAPDGLCGFCQEELEQAA
jgi:ParB-like chromosome segregation protein Spo0J